MKDKKFSVSTLYCNIASVHIEVQTHFFLALLYCHCFRVQFETLAFQYLQHINEIPCLYIFNYFDIVSHVAKAVLELTMLPAMTLS